MKIEMSDEELKLLMGIFSLTEKVLTNYSVEKTKEMQEIEILRKKISALINESNDKGFIDNEKFRKVELQNGLNQFEKPLAEFQVESFWEHLILKLAERDVLDYFNVANINDLDMKKRIEETARFEYFWANEFEEFGLARLTVADTERS